MQKDRLVPEPTERPTVTVDEAAQILGISRSSAFSAVRRGDIPSLQIGRRLVVPTAALRRMLQLDADPSANPQNAA